MKEKRVYTSNRKVTKSFVLKNEFVSDVNKLNSYMGMVDQSVKKVVQKNPLTKLNVLYNRVDDKYNNKKLEVCVYVNVEDRFGLDDSFINYIELNKRRETECSDRISRLKEIYDEYVIHYSDVKKPEVTEWTEQVVRVGTGFRVRIDDKDPQLRRFDVGYADVKPYKRKSGRIAKVDVSSISRTIIGKGKDIQVKVINAVSDIEKRRPVSKYTGSGIRRKNIVGKMKLKSTKAGGKD